jgi:hypothetical protein
VIAERPGAAGRAGLQPAFEPLLVQDAKRALSVATSSRFNVMQTRSSVGYLYAVEIQLTESDGALGAS